VGLRGGFGDFLRLALAAIVGLLRMYADSTVSNLVRTLIVIFMTLISLVMLATFLWASPRQYKGYVLPRSGDQFNLFMLRKVPFFVFIHSALECLGNMTVAATGVDLLINQGWSSNDWLLLFFCNTLAMSTTSLFAGWIVHCQERSVHPRANPLNLLYIPSGYFLKAICIAFVHTYPVATVIVVLTVCDFIGHARTISINYAMTNALHRELFILGVVLRSIIEGCLNFVSGMWLCGMLAFAPDFVSDSASLVAVVVLVGVFAGIFQLIVGRLLFGYYDDERLNIP